MTTLVIKMQKIRSSLGRTEIELSLYVCFVSDHNPNPNPNPLWFTLCLKPNQALTNRNVLVPTSIPHFAPPHWSGLIGGPSNDIYNIGGPIDNAPSSGEARSLWVDPTINVLDRKVYVTRRSSEDCEDLFEQTRYGLEAHSRQHRLMGLVKRLKPIKKESPRHLASFVFSSISVTEMETFEVEKIT